MIKYFLFTCFLSTFLSVTLASSDQHFVRIESKERPNGKESFFGRPLFSYPKEGKWISVFEQGPEGELLKNKSLVTSSWNSDSLVAYGQFYDLAPFPEEEETPRKSEQWALDFLFAEETWAFTLGASEIVIAVTDDGVDINHEALKDSIWKNDGEIPLNGVDDDNNGHVDDINGWNFIDSNSNVLPKVSFFSGSHGTHVAGIIAGQNSGGVEGMLGLAPQVKIMPLLWYRKGSLSLEHVMKSYLYAVDNGAKIISTSYRIDQFVDHPLYKAILEYIEYKNVILVNSAGNSNKLNPARGKNEYLFLVGSINENEERSEFSNYGQQIDISAPGSKILSTIPGNQYREMSGTSMAAPYVAASMGLVWSLHPKWSASEVVAHIKRQSRRDFLGEYFGGGGLNPFKAVSTAPAPGQMKGITNLIDKELQGNGIIVGLKDSFTAESLLNPNAWRLYLLEGQELVKEVDLEILTKRVQLGTNQIQLKAKEELVPGRIYRLIVSDSITSLFGEKLDGDNNSVEGGDYIEDFRAVKETQEL